MAKISKYDGLTDDERIELEERTRQRVGEKHSTWSRRAARVSEEYAAKALAARNGVAADPEHLIIEGEDEDEDED
jgi:hypothetical protein